MLLKKRHHLGMNAGAIDGHGLSITPDHLLRRLQA
jgi:hypothetical protein